MEAVQVLVASGADVDVTNTHFRTPYDDANRQGHISLLPFLDGSEKIGKKLLPDFIFSRGRGGTESRSWV